MPSAYRIEELERTVLFNIDTSTSVEESKELSGDAIAIVDPFSTGAAMAAMINERNIQVIAVYSKNLEQLASLQALVPKDMVITFAALVGYKPNLNDMIKDINNCGLNVLAVIAGAETGVELADALSERMGLRTNGSALSEARRNKYVMGETIRAAGVRAVKQLKSSSWHEIEAYVTEWNPNPFKVIVKPVDSAGSDGVTLCHSISEIKQIFEYLIGRVNGLGATNSGVLVQEYLEGKF
jgi:biotin carboxylase